MKKYFIFLSIFILMLTGCNEKKENVKQEVKEKKRTESIYEDKNPIEIGLYIKKNGERVLTREYEGPFILNQDIGVFSAFYTHDEMIDKGSIKNVWFSYFQNYQNIEKYKIGYFISFSTESEGKIEKLIQKPEDTQSIYDFIQIYLYDDIHQQDGAWYSHIEKEDENTIMTSIKLTGSTLTHEITSPIILTAFTYSGREDFDPKTSLYRGKSKFEMTITNGKNQ